MEEILGPLGHAKPVIHKGILTFVPADAGLFLYHDLTYLPLSKLDDHPTMKFTMVHLKSIPLEKEIPILDPEGSGFLGKHPLPTCRSRWFQLHEYVNIPKLQTMLLEKNIHLHIHSHLRLPGDVHHDAWE